jgi:hypothetical protein
MGQSNLIGRASKDMRAAGRTLGRAHETTPHAYPNFNDDRKSKRKRIILTNLKKSNRKTVSPPPKYNAKS